jgi:hypothetical protein
MAWKIIQCGSKEELDRETRLPMVRRIMQWIPITALLLTVTWRPSGNYQILLNVAVCAGAVTVLLALLFIKCESETGL